MPFVYGFLRRARRHGWRPGGGPVDPDYGIDEGLHPEVDPPDPDGDLEVGGGPILPDRPSIPTPPPGIWPPMHPGDAWRPVDPGFGAGRPPHVGGGPMPPTMPTPPAGGIGGRPPERPQPGPGGGGEEVAPPIVLPPGVVWPPLPPGVHGKWLALVVVFGMGGGPKYRYVVIDADLRPGRPDNTLPGDGEAQPK